MRNALRMLSVSLIVALFLPVGAAGAALTLSEESHPITSSHTEPAAFSQDTVIAAAATVPTRELTLAATEITGRTMTVTDDSGETITIQGTPQRIISLAPSNTEIVYALDLGDRIVGVADNSNYPPEATDKPKTGGYSSISIEKVIAAEPDLIVAAPGNTDEVIDHL